MVKKIISATAITFLLTSMITFVGTTTANAVAPVISSTSTISNTQANPSITITTSASGLNSTSANWPIDFGTTGLTRTGMSTSNGIATINFSGTATCGGTLTVRANAAAYTAPLQSENSNTLTFVISGSTCSSDSTLSAASTIKGVVITSLGTPGTNPSNVVARGSVTISATQAANTSNSGSFVTSFIRNQLNATVVYVSKNSSSQSTSTVNASYVSAAINTGDYFVTYITSQDNSSASLYVIDVTITGDSGSSSSSAGLTPVFASGSSLDGRYTVQVSNYDSAYTYAVTSTAGQASISSSGLVTVTGLSKDQAVSVTVTTTRTGYDSASASNTGRSQVLPMLPTNKPTVTLSDTLITCTIGSYSAAPTSAAFSLFVDGKHTSTIFSALGEYLPDWIIPWATSNTITRTASLTSATWAMSDAYKGKSITCATLAYSKNAIGFTASQVMVAR